MATVSLPSMGNVVHALFPDRGWRVPAMVVAEPDPRDPEMKLELFVFNPNTAFQKVHHRHGVPHSTRSNGSGVAWAWPK